ncbi:recombinase family protein [Sphingomonas metalli]|jgi:DNA invertase Pin-like site-specific DNA recombinase|nr:recombinase family protein [Sphingomonas metalli]
MMTDIAPTSVRAARVYLRVSTEEQDLTRQDAIVAGARSAGYYVAAVYREKASGARPDRPELLRMVEDLQMGEVVVAEKIDRISRLPLPEAELLVAAIRAKGARLAVPGIVDLSDLVADSAGVARIVLEAVQDMLLRVALQTARDEYETRRERQREGIEIARGAGRYTGRKADFAQHRRIVALREAGMSIAKTAELAGCSIAQVKRVTAQHRSRNSAQADVQQPGDQNGSRGVDRRMG